MKNKKILYVSFTIAFVISLFYFICMIKSGDYKINYKLRMSEQYYLSIGGTVEKEKYASLDRFGVEIEKGMHCYFVDYIAFEKGYYVGYIYDISGNGKNKECEGYFYIKKDSEEIKMKLSKAQIEEKFGTDIYYMNSRKFVNRYGTGGDINIDFQDLIIITLILGILIFLLIFSIILLSKKIIAMLCFL